MSHEDSQFKFVNDKAVLIYGVNNSDEGQQSNGSGKSVILEAIAIALLGSTLRDEVTAKDLVMNGQLSAKVSLELFNTISQETLRIERVIWSNTKSSELSIYINNELHPVVSVNDGNSFILSKIGISKEDLLNFFLISKEKYTPFLSMSDKPKREMISRFSQADLIDPVFDSIKSEVLGHETEERSIQRTIDSSTGKLEVLNEQKLKLTNTDEELEKQNSIKELKRNIVIASEENISFKNRIRGLELDIKVTQDHITASNVSKLELQSKIDSYKSNRDIIATQYNELNTELKDAITIQSQYEKDILSSVECPKCEHQFSISDSTLDIDKLKADKVELETVIDEIKADIEKITLQGQQLTENNKSIQLEYDRLGDEIKQLEQDNETRQREIRTLTSSIQNNDETVIYSKKKIEVIESGNDSTKLKEINISINSIQKELKDKNKELLEVQQKKADAIEWIGNFNKFKIFLSNKAIGVVQVFANEYLSKMKSSLSLQIEGYKINKDGSLRDNITATVLRDGIVCGSFGKFSSGERARINIALILSLQRLINMNSSTGGLDLCFLDEIIESVDSEGIYSIINSLNDLNQTIIVITHGSIDKAYPNTVLIEKTNGISIINQ